MENENFITQSFPKWNWTRNTHFSYKKKNQMTKDQLSFQTINHALCKDNWSLHNNEIPSYKDRP